MQVESVESRASSVAANPPGAYSANMHRGQTETDKNNMRHHFKATGPSTADASCTMLLLDQEVTVNEQP